MANRRYRLSPWVTSWNFGGEQLQADDAGWFTPQTSEQESAMMAAGAQPEEFVDHPSLAIRRAAAKLEAAAAPCNVARLWAPATAINQTETYILPTGELVVCSVAGTTGSTAPSINAPGTAPGEITDNTVKWWWLGEASRLGYVPMWAAATVVQAGQRLALPTGQRVRVHVGGTTGGTAPTYAATGTITDNTATLVADAPYSPDDASSQVTVTDVAGNSVLTLYNLFDSPEFFDQPVAKNLVNIAGTDATKRNCAWAFNNGSSSEDHGLGVGLQAKYRTAECMTNSDVIEIGYFCAIAGFVGEHIMVWIDGARLNEAALVPFALGQSRFHRLTIKGGRRKRRIRIAARGATSLRYIGINADCYLERPPVSHPVLAFFGDSWLDTEMPNLSLCHQDLAVLTGQRLGFPHVMHGGLGGTSYSVASGGRLGLDALLSYNDWSGYKFDAFMVAQGYNAAGNGVSTAVECAAALPAWGKLRSINTVAPIIIINVWYRHPSYSAAADAMRIAIRNQFLAWADRNSALIDPIDGSIIMGDGTVVRRGTGPWISAAAANWLIPSTGVGDGAHVVIPGRRHITDCVSDAAEAALQALGY